MAIVRFAVVLIAVRHALRRRSRGRQRVRAGGGEKVCRRGRLGVRAALRGGKDVGDLAADANDAYQHADRQGMLEEYSASSPETYAAAYTGYKRPRPVIVRGSRGGPAAIIWSYQGTLQGAPLGPAPFCLGQHPHLQRTLDQFRTGSRMCSSG